MWVPVSVKSLSRVWFFATSWPVACQALLSLGFSAIILEWVAISSSRGGLSDPGIKPSSPVSPAMLADYLPLRHREWSHLEKVLTILFNNMKKDGIWHRPLGWWASCWKLRRFHIPRTNNSITWSWLGSPRSLPFPTPSRGPVFRSCERRDGIPGSLLTQQATQFMGSGWHSVGKNLETLSNYPAFLFVLP